MAKQSAADYVEAKATYVGVILGELAENAGRSAADWALAVESVRERPEHALELLVDIDIKLGTFIRIERQDALRVIRAGISRLDVELPDDE